jgi:hypothetical protein
LSEGCPEQLDELDAGKRLAQNPNLRPPEHMARLSRNQNGLPTLPTLGSGDCPLGPLVGPHQLIFFEAIGLCCLNPQSPCQCWNGDCALSGAELDRSGQTVRRYTPRALGTGAATEGMRLTFLLKEQDSNTWRCGRGVYGPGKQEF